MRHAEHPEQTADGVAPPGSAEERLAAALEALAARDLLLADRGRRLAALEADADRLAAATASLHELTRDLTALRLARQAELAERDTRITGLEAALVQARRAAEARPQPGDDLKQIKGIGPVIEGLLHAMGITTFRQVAGLSPEQRARLGDLLGVFRARIDRDGWIEQAARLAGPLQVTPGTTLAAGG